MITELEFDSDVPEEIKKPIFDLFCKYRIVYPATCRILHVAFDAEPNDSASLSTNGRPEYGFMKIWVKPNWLKHNEEAREKTFAHEVAHALLWPMQVFTEQLLDHLVKDDNPLKELTQVRLTNSEEIVVQELGEALYRLLNRK